MKTPKISRREWMLGTAGALVASGCHGLRMAPLAALPTNTADARLGERVQGMLIGSMIGDAAGGPVEFKTRDELSKLVSTTRVWREDDRIDVDVIRELTEGFRLLPYEGIRPQPEPYAHWTADAAAGTVTDDTRIKILLISALRKARAQGTLPISVRDLASQFVDFHASRTVRTCAGYAELCEEWLAELNKSARWVLGDRTAPVAAPPERLWGGIASCCGQMLLPPIAAIYPGQPECAYRAAYSMGFMDNGPGKDMNAAIVAGLATAFALPDQSPQAAWAAVIRSMIETDPYEYAKVPHVERSVDLWLRFSREAAERAERSPARLFEIVLEGLNARTWWAAHVPFVVTFASLHLCDYQPIAAMQLCLDFGYDTDSAAQLAGAFAGAIHGAGLFPKPMRKRVAEQFRADYDESVTDWVDLLLDLRNRIRYPEPIAFPS